MPPRKRIASVALVDDTGTVEARIRRHLATIAASQAAIVSLLDQLLPSAVAPPPSGIFIPNDIVRHILEFVLGRRRCAQFGVDGLLYPASFDDAQSNVAALRLINKQWARIGGELIRWLRVPVVSRCKPAALASAFPNTSRVSLYRCVIDRAAVTTLSTVVKAFSYRPKHLFFVDVEFCSTIGKLVFDCHGTLAQAEVLEDCPSQCKTMWPGENLKLINTLYGNGIFGWRGPDAIYITCGAEPEEFASTLAHPMNVGCDFNFFQSPPPRARAAFRAICLQIQVYGAAFVHIPQLAAWLDPALWKDGRRPLIKWIVHNVDGRDIAASITQTLSEQMHVDSSILIDW